MIKLLILGNLGKNAEIKHFDGAEKSVVNFSVAHTETFVKNGVKEQSTTWISASWWLKKEVAIKTAPYLLKGKKVFIEGQPSARAYMKDNTAMAILELNVIKLEFAEAAPPQGQQQAAPAQQPAAQQQAAAPAQQASYAPPIDMNNPPEDDDLPF